MTGYWNYVPPRTGGGPAVPLAGLCNLSEGLARSTLGLRWSVGWTTDSWAWYDPEDGVPFSHPNLDLYGNPTFLTPGDSYWDPEDGSGYVAHPHIDHWASEDPPDFTPEAWFPGDGVPITLTVPAGAQPDTELTSVALYLQLHTYAGNGSDKEVIERPQHCSFLVDGAVYAVATEASYVSSWSDYILSTDPYIAAYFYGSSGEVGLDSTFSFHLRWEPSMASPLPTWAVEGAVLDVRVVPLTGRDDTENHYNFKAVLDRQYV